jgi:hypothetical protein
MKDRSSSTIKIMTGGVNQMNEIPNKELAENRDKMLVSQVLTAIKGIDYGQVLLKVHDSRVMQIERAEKIKIPRPRECICK